MPGANCYQEEKDSNDTDYVIGSALDLLWGFSHRHYCKDFISKKEVQFSIGSVVKKETEKEGHGELQAGCPGDGTAPCFVSFDA